ncbi:GGDEF domain-containing protein [Marinomonas atlantica]|uniref:GGDEF domain-containing protein n=1 Tax=Marinomonas atlantica TaxID=1806668 RepID=UPI000831D59E|nr:GGDEF domain-containing protein [Marinomonas atlantica]MCO4784991.1 diguanylate cyclase [Marinomonas atlantica]
MDPTQDKVIESLLKAVSRTSMLAEGTDPELDATLQNIRTNLSKSQSPEVLQQTLQTLEPLVLSFDEQRLARAQAFRGQLLDLIDSVDELPNTQMLPQAKKQLEADIRKHWQSVSSWPELLAKTVKLVTNTLTQPTTETKNGSLLGRFFRRKGDQSPISKNDSEIMSHVSHTLAALLANITLPDIYRDQLVDIKNALTGNKDINHLPALLDEVINLIMVAVGKTQEDLTLYLSQLNEQLASINASIIANYKAQRSMSSTRKDLGETFQQHVDSTQTDVRNATDLNDLKSLIDERMHTITEAMTQFQDKMQNQEKHAAQSISLLKNKVNRMEQDATQLRSNMQQKIAQALSDALTGLPNRAAYQEAIFPLLTSATQIKQPLCIAVCDVDHFKRINDTWGHLAGDKVLRIIPRQMQNALSKESLIFRYGGEEFIIVFPMTAIDKAREYCEKVREAVESTPFNMNGDPVSVSISIGIAQFNGKESHDELFSRADKNLYKAKEQGRNRVIHDN